MEQPPRILIVEDEVIIAMYLEMELQHAGYQVCQHVTTGEEAVRIARRDAPGCILMDIRLAGDIDGIEAAQHIQAQADIPIIFMTGYPDKTIEDRAKALHPLGFFLKPVQAAALQPLLESLRQSVCMKR